jgi:hypothetical protein
MTDENEPCDEVMVTITKKEYEELIKAFEKVQAKKQYYRTRIEKYKEEHGCTPSNDWQKKNKEKVNDMKREYNRLRYHQKKESAKLIISS